MKQTVYRNDFHDAFKSIRPEQFTYAGLNALFEYFEELEDDLGEETSLDVIAICCEYSEYSFDNIRVDWDHLLDESDLDDPVNFIEAMNEYTTVIYVNSDFYIIQDF